MASYPGANVHRRSRRKLGRAQYPQLEAATMAPVDTVAEVVITFSVPVIVSGDIDLQLDPPVPLLTQVVTSPTVVTQTYGATVTGSDWVFAGGTGNVRTREGGAVAPAAGSF